MRFRMKKNLFVLLSQLVIASMMLAACAPVSNETAAIIVHGSTPDVKLRPEKDNDAVFQLNIVYFEGQPGTTSHTAGSLIDSLWFINEPAGDTPAVTPTEFQIHMKKGNLEFTTTIMPGGNSSVYAGRPEEFEILEISAVGWVCDRRGEENIWDCKFKK